MVILKDEIEREAEWLRKHNDNMEKMLSMVTATVDVKEVQLVAIEEKLSQYIVRYVLQCKT